MLPFLNHFVSSFAASLGNTLEEMFRIRSELEDQQQKAKKLEEDRKRLQAARRAPGRRHLHQLDPSMVAQPVTSFQPTTQTPQQQTVAVSQSQATPPIPIATQPQPEAQSGRQPSINDSQVNQLWIGRQRPQIHQRVQSTIISPTTTQTGGIYQPSVCVSLCDIQIVSQLTLPISPTLQMLLRELPGTTDLLVHPCKA